jgi:IPT/TIG domain
MRSPLIVFGAFLAASAPDANARTDAAFAEPADRPRGTFVIEVGERGARCRSATPTESNLFEGESPVPLHFIKGGEQDAKRAAAGLNIQLRGTSQLDSYPEAKAAFIRAAERWEAVLQDPVSIIIDVDFGPTHFGTPYPAPNILGLTRSDPRTGPYTDIAPKLLAKHPSLPLYQNLPVAHVPTDQGSAATVAATAASLRSLALLPANQGSGDLAPQIAFNSAMPFDFDPSDGVDSGKSDFDTTATHEIGHVLGYFSMVGDKELHPTDEVIASTWDIFRFRPGMTTADFKTAPRVLASGGDQIFFDSEDEVPLSTGRAEDGSGGDGQQASHWKDDELLGSYVGIMDPTLSSGVHAYMTIWDLLGIGFIGWSISSDTFNQAHVDSVSPDTFTPGGSGGTVTIEGSSFVNGASVLWKGSPRSTTLVSASRLTANVTASDVAAPGKASIEVENPGAIVSNARYVSIGTPEATCTPSATTLCLGGGRFSVTASWHKSDGSSGSGTAVPLTSDTGYFWFFNSSNIELVTKVLNGCALTNAYWVFAAGLTDVGVVLDYTDLQTQTARSYSSPLGTAFLPIQDTSALKTCP